MIKNRSAKKDQTSGYFDWYLIYLGFGLGVTGMGAQLTRLADWAFFSAYSLIISAPVEALTFPMKLVNLMTNLCNRDWKK